MQIHLLSEKTIKLIAAGEIIFRPAAALKELIENSIDAKSTAITIHVNDAGLEKLIVIDDGEGMDEQDLKLCIKMHATSKTSDEDNYFGRHSMGFRGEALASIEAAADLTIETKGRQLHNGLIANSDVQQGTKITVTNMFAKIPARLKFIRNKEIERDYIKQLLKKFIIIFPCIKWIVYMDNKKIWQFEKNEKNTLVAAETRIAALFNDHPHYFEYASDTQEQLKIEGCIFKKHKRSVMLFVNKRSVKDNKITTYLNSIFKEYFMKHEAPSYILSIEIDPMFVDYNVHPAKEEIKFISYDAIYKGLSGIFCHELFNKFYKEENTISVAVMQPLIKTKVKGKNMQSRRSPIENIQFVNEPLAFMPHEIKPIYYNIIGQIKNSYIIFETEHGIGIFDQHAAHERQIYERMKESLNANERQKLLIPIKLNLSAEQRDYVKTNLDEFARKGIVIERGHVITHAPNLLNVADFKHLFEYELSQNIACAIMIDRLLANIACKQALKANTKLSFEQMDSLLRQSLQTLPICNHGRHVFKYFSKTEIGSWFNR
jgi:DNA mismatch repair protein MutL